MVFRHLARRFDASAAARPVAFACVTQTLKTTVTDVAVQLGVERRETLDVQRTVAFTAFGFAWMGAAQYYIYVRLFDALLPAKTAVTAAAKVALDQFVYVPFVFFPAFYTVDAVVRREEPVLLAARDRYLREIWRTCVDTWPFSIAAQFVGFRFVPSHLLIPYVTCCSFVFTGLVSGLQGKFRLAERQGVALPPPEASLPLPTILAEESRSSSS